MAVSMVHEHMHQWTGKDQKEWKRSEQVRPVFGVEEEAAHKRNDHQGDAAG